MHALELYCDSEVREPPSAPLLFGTRPRWLRDTIREELRSLESLKEQAELWDDPSPPPRASLSIPQEAVFIGHGRSPIWQELKDFVERRLGMGCREYNTEAVAGLARKERLTALLNECSFALLVLVAEDEHQDGTKHARENVIHEVGLFQGRLGFERAIVLLEQGCQEFSNIQGLEQLRFPKGCIAAVFEGVRQVMEREGLVRRTPVESRGAAGS